MEQGRVHTLLIVASPTPTIGRTYTLQSNGDGHEVDGRVGQRDLDVVGHGWLVGRDRQKARRRGFCSMGTALLVERSTRQAGRGAQAPCRDLPACACVGWGVDTTQMSVVSARGGLGDQEW